MKTWKYFVMSNDLCEHVVNTWHIEHQAAADYGILRSALVLFEWCENNVTGSWTREGHQYFFEKEEDATLFLLRWS